MTSDLLQKLKNLKRVRGDASPFSSPLEYETWTDEVAPLLSFNEKLQNSFKHYVKIAKFNSRTNSSNIDQINETIGILNQAITSLEVMPVHNAATNPAKNPSDARMNPLSMLHIDIFKTVAGGLVLACVFYLIATHFGLKLNG
ncbi:MAG: hypothetical protein HZB47_03450 [Nitrosomonadales bacterium]|nr:hypothetical protein [Nitrosomonadales bacterium]